MITLFEHYKPIARIILSPTASKAEHRAATEFQRVIRQMSGAELVITTTEPVDTPGVYIGRAASESEVDLSETRLGFDGYLIKVTGQRLILMGRRGYSALYAVYHVLERHLGCGFFEEGDQIPQRASGSIEDMETYCKPRFQWRLYFANMQDAYSGMRWWTWEEFKPWIDYLVKKRFNILEGGNIADRCGIGALAAARLGIRIELTDWQNARIALLRKVFDYAREAGIRIRYPMHLHVGTPNVQPGFAPYVDGQQLQTFVDRYQEKHDTRIAVAPLEWCGEAEIVLDPRDPVTQQFTTAVVESFIEALGTDHLYGIWLPTEETWVEDDPERAAELTHASVDQMISAIKAGDPDAFVFSPRVCTDNPTEKAQAMAVREAGLPVVGNMFLNHNGRMYDFLRTDYYWGLPWTTGMCGQCGRETNPNGDINAAIMNARMLADHPKAANLVGFMVSTETNHRNVMTMDLYAELSWNPAEVDPDEYVRRWNQRRYGDAAPATWPATKLFADTLMSYFDPCTHNGPLYRNWDGTGLAGLTSGSVKRLIGFLPALYEMLNFLRAQHHPLKDSPMYRFDMIDLGRTYLAGIFNDRLARTRKAFRAKNREAFDLHASEVVEVMHMMARYCSAHKQFRLKTHDDWAARWPQIIAGHENSESNWITFTALISMENWVVLLDYLPEDFAEMVAHYFLPRVKQYIQKMGVLMDQGKDISERLVDRGSDIDLPSRVANWSTPQGNALWSAFGDTCEPELTADDESLAYELIKAGSVSGKFDFYDGPLDTLVDDLLTTYPPPEDLDEILAEQDYAVAGHCTMLAGGVPGETVEGFNVPGFVERVTLPQGLSAYISVREVRREYNIARGEIFLYQIIISPEVHLTRQDNARSETDDHGIAVFLFEVNQTAYRLMYDSGTDLDVASFDVQPV
jgi:hypothetical protein